jgi:predicted nucleotidyltransferase component of viral defense system
MIDRREILEAASSFSLLPNVVEKDYFLGWVLAGINAHEELAESWLFKGGTCLKKCYFETYRFSEDLDFTLRNEDHVDEEFSRSVFEEDRHVTVGMAHTCARSIKRRIASPLLAHLSCVLAY